MLGWPLGFETLELDALKTQGSRLNLDGANVDRSSDVFASTYHSTGILAALQLHVDEEAMSYQQLTTASQPATKA